MRIDRGRLLAWLGLLLWVGAIGFAIWFINDMRTGGGLRPGGGLVLAAIFGAMFVAKMIRAGWTRRADKPPDTSDD
jgi:hypothetical protein